MTSETNFLSASAPGADTSPKNNEAILELLPKILRLTSEDRQRLAQAWSAMDVDFQRSSLIVYPPTEVPTEQDLESEVREVQDWIRTTSRIDVRKRLAQFDEAIIQEKDVGRDWAVDLIGAERKRILDGNRMLTVEYIVAKYAYQNPFLMVIGLLGLGLAIYRLLAGLFKLVF